MLLSLVVVAMARTQGRLPRPVGIGMLVVFAGYMTVRVIMIATA